MTRCTCTVKVLQGDEAAMLQGLYRDVYGLNIPNEHLSARRTIYDRRCPTHGHPACRCLPLVDAEIDINKQIGWSVLLCDVHNELED